MNAERRRRPVVLVGLLAFLTVSSAEACSKNSAPSTPTDSGAMYLGTWKGSVTSEVVGGGTATIVLDSGVKSAASIQVSGTWRLAFVDSRFDGSGTVSGGPLPDGSALVLLFSPSAVPCPAELSGVTTKGRTATLSLTGNRMQGSYIANGCPGGALDLRRE